MQKRRQTSRVAGPSRPVSARERWDGACGRLVDAVMVGDREAAAVAWVECRVLLRLAFPAVWS